jgi:putative alpha-1,2-mannosidase
MSKHARRKTILGEKTSKSNHFPKFSSLNSHLSILNSQLLQTELAEGGTLHFQLCILNSQLTSSTPPWLSETRYPPNLTPCRIRSHQIIAELFELLTTERLVFCFESLRFDQMGF